MSYPQFRKYKNDKSYFKINSVDTFEEIQIRNNNYFLHHFTAKILPDRNYILDMLTNYEEYWDAITEAEYEVIKTKV